MIQVKFMDKKNHRISFPVILSKVTNFVVFSDNFFPNLNKVPPFFHSLYQNYFLYFVELKGKFTGYSPQKKYLAPILLYIFG